MADSIKLSAIHSYYPQLPELSNPENERFDPASLKKFCDGNLEKTLRFIDDAGREKVDLVCTHEDIKGQAYLMTCVEKRQLFEALAEEIPGPASDRIGSIASKYKMYVAANYYEKAGDKIYNTSVLIGRSGEIIGKYRKVHLPVIEKWMVTPGKEFPVFTTDIGQIGFATCYDIIFPEHCRALALNGADIVVHQTAGWGIVRYNIGEALVRIRAAENAVYLVVAKDIRYVEGPKSCIINNYGDILAEEQGKIERIVAAEFVPDFDMISYHFSSLLSGIDSVRGRMALEREPSLYSVISKQDNPALLRYKDKGLATSPERIKEVRRQWKEYDEDIENGRPVKIKYHWDR